MPKPERASVLDSTGKLERTIAFNARRLPINV
jgi:hypothetical protein